MITRTYKISNPIKTGELLKEFEGLRTIKAFQSLFNLDRTRAIYLIHRLKKLGYVKTSYNKDKTRVYNIDRMHRLNGTNYIKIINQYVPSGIKLAENEINMIYGRIPSIEETLIYAIKQESIRFVIASLALFRQIKNWSLLYKLAKKDNLVREVAALYDISRLVVRKVRKMPKRFKNLAAPKKNDKYKYIIDRFSSDNFQDIERKWKVYIPLNQADLEEYKYQ